MGERKGSRFLFWGGGGNQKPHLLGLNTQADSYQMERAASRELFSMAWAKKRYIEKERQ